MHWNQYASPSVQREWSRVQAELRAKETREYRIEVVAEALLDQGTASFIAQDIAGRIRDLLGTKWHGTKHEVVVRVLFPTSPGDDYILLRVTKMDPWSDQQAAQADHIVDSIIPSAQAVSKHAQSPDTLWQAKEGVYTGTAIDDTWRSAIGMGGGKPWGSKHHA